MACVPLSRAKNREDDENIALVEVCCNSPSDSVAGANRRVQGIYEALFEAFLKHKLAPSKEEYDALESLDKERSRWEGRRQKLYGKNPDSRDTLTRIGQLPVSYSLR